VKAIKSFGEGEKDGRSSINQKKHCKRKNEGSGKANGRIAFPRARNRVTCPVNLFNVSIHPAMKSISIKYGSRDRHRPYCNGHPRFERFGTGILRECGGRGVASG